MLNNLIIAAIPHTEPWGFNTAFVMVVCNSVAVAILWLSSYLEGNSPLAPQFTLPELIATFSIGHIIGVGMLLGLTSIGTI